MAKNNDTMVDAVRVTTIANLIRSKCLVLAEPAEQMDEAQKSITALSQGMNLSRIAVIAEVAALSAAQDWTAAELKVACDQAAKGNSDDRSAKTVGVFISEMKTFASPKVRNELPTIIEACEAAWRDEEELLAECETTAERNAVETPVRKFKSRKYHLIMGAARAVKSGELRVECAQDIVDWCVENDPDFDEDKVAAKLKAVVDALEKIHVDFGMAEIRTAADYLITITGKELLASRKAMLNAAAQRDAERLEGHRLAPLPPAALAQHAAPSTVPPAPAASVVLPPAPIAAPIVNANPPTIGAFDTGSVAAGVFDLLNDEEEYDEDEDDNSEDASVNVQTNDRAEPVTLAQIVAAQVAAE